MTTPTSDVDTPVDLSRKKRLSATLERLRRGLRARWEWYREQQAQDRERHWWDVYNR